MIEKFNILFMKKANVKNIIDQLNIRIGLLNLLIIRIENIYLVNHKKKRSLTPLFL